MVSQTWSKWPKWPLIYEEHFNQQLPEINLRRGQDFDIVVHEISIASLPFISPQLLEASPSLRSAHEHVETVIIKAHRLWSDVPFDDLVTPRSENEIHFQQYNPYYIGQVTDHRIKMEDWEEIGLDPKHSLSLDESVKHNNIPPAQTTLS